MSIERRVGVTVLVAHALLAIGVEWMVEPDGRRMLCGLFILLGVMLVVESLLAAIFGGWESK